MTLQFLKYFLHYIFHAKTRQRLLFLAVVGLFISSFALIILQSTMGGLQNNLIKRSKAVLGSATIYLKDKSPEFSDELIQEIEGYGHQAFAEYEMEMLLRNRGYLFPVIVHGIDIRKKSPDFLKEEILHDTLMPIDLAMRLGVSLGDDVQLISTSHVDSLLTDIPRLTTASVGSTFSTQVSEIDQYHIWVRLGLIHNLIRKLEYNIIRVYSPEPLAELKEKMSLKHSDNILFKTWEDENHSLVWALRLETTIMVSLFVAMTMLVSLTITSGLMIFYDKVKGDLASFWILGISKNKLEKSSFAFFNLLSFMSVGLGLVLGLCFLFMMDKFAVNVLPDIFVDRNIPIFITTKGVLISFFVPYTISIIFTFIVLGRFQSKQSFLEYVRTIGG